MSLIERKDVSDEEMGDSLFRFQEALFMYLGYEGVIGFPEEPWHELHKVASLLKNGWYRDLREEPADVP